MTVYDETCRQFLEEKFALNHEMKYQCAIKWKIKGG